MPFLNWKELKIEQTVQSTPGGGALWRMKATASDFHSLVEYLEEVMGPAAPEGSELRVNLPQEWTLFWKRTEGSSKLLVARPEQGQWVGTLALQSSHAARLMDALKRIQAGQVVRVGALGDDLHSVNNLELELVVSTS